MRLFSVDFNFFPFAHIPCYLFFSRSVNNEILARLGKALPNNTIVTELLVANCAIDSTGSVALIEGLRTNKTLTSFNIESNMSATPFPLFKKPSLADSFSLFLFLVFFFS